MDDQSSMEQRVIEYATYSEVEFKVMDILLLH
jgi:hypothetical protein